MQIITVKEGQTLLDVAKQYLGDATQAFAIALMNGKSVTDELEPGTTLTLNDADANKQNIVNEFKQNALVPATSGGLAFTGIGFWYVQNNNIVS